MLKSDDAVQMPDWYLDVCDDWSQEVHTFYADASRLQGAKPRVVHLHPHTCGHLNCNAAKRCLHATDCPCKFGKLASSSEERADAELLKLHATESLGRFYTLTVGKADRRAGWCQLYPGDGSAVRCDGVPMGTNPADLQEKAVLEIARAQHNAA